MKVKDTWSLTISGALYSWLPQHPVVGRWAAVDSDGFSSSLRMVCSNFSHYDLRKSCIYVLWEAAGNAKPQRAGETWTVTAISLA